MSVTCVRGKDVRVKQTPMVLYSIFSDLRRFAENLPQDLKEKVEVEADSITATSHGMEMGLKISQRVPFSLISFSETGKFPFPFGIDFHFAPEGFDSTTFYIELHAELPAMAKMMVGNKLQEMVDKITEQLEQAINTQPPYSYGS